MLGAVLHPSLSSASIPAAPSRFILRVHRKNGRTGASGAKTREESHRETGRKGRARFFGKATADLGVGAASPNPLFSLSPRLPVKAFFFRSSVLPVTFFREVAA
jgi:hypothetical protein